MFDFPKWKLGLVVVLVLLAAVYALPNVFPEQPAIQISANRGSTIDEVLQGRVEGTLKGKEIPYFQVERTEERLTVRFPDADHQLKGADALREELKEKYTVALNLASTVPAWLSAVGARPMTLGLDLQGGVHFLMEVDQQAARAKLEDRYVNDLYTILRAGKVAYKSVTRARDGLVVELVTPEDKAKAMAEIAEQSPDLLLESPAGSTTTLLAKIRPEKVVEAQTHTIDQNITTLRNRVSELGVAEPVIAQQGQTRIVVQLPGVQDTAAAKKILGATATLEYRAVNDNANAVEAAATGKVPPDSRLYYDQAGSPVLLKKDVIATGDQLVDATSGFDQQSGTPMVSVRLDSAGGMRMLDFTSENVGRPMAVVYIERVPEFRKVDGKEVRSFKETQTVISVASIRGVFSTNFQTTGLESANEARDLALLLRAGSLAVPVDIIEERIIGPSLGQDNIERGPRGHADRFPADRDLRDHLLPRGRRGRGDWPVRQPAVADGDPERARRHADDARHRRYRADTGHGGGRQRADRRAYPRRSPVGQFAHGSAASAGYEKAWGTILDANLTTLFAAIAMFAFGSGPVKGFAVTMFTGILTSMFSAVTVTQLIMAMVYGRQRKVQSISV